MPRPDAVARRTRGLLVPTRADALISLALAAISPGYNTWRNETTEMQRNWRQASFQVLIEVGELNQIVLYRRYFHAPAAKRDRKDRWRRSLRPKRRDQRRSSTEITTRRFCWRFSGDVFGTLGRPSP